MDGSRPRKKSKWTKRVLARTASALGPGLLRLLGATWRLRVLHDARLDERGAGARPVVAMWHENIPVGSVVGRGRRVAALISQHRDGAIIARVIERLGFRTVRGSSTRGGVRAVRSLLREADPDWALLVTPDGPRGPRHAMAPGAVFVAAATGRPLVAVGFAAKRAWRLGSWDRMLFPKPFTRVVAVFAEPIRLRPEDVGDDAGLDAARGRLTEALHAARAEAERSLGGPGA